MAVTNVAVALLVAWGTASRAAFLKGAGRQPAEHVQLEMRGLAGSRPTSAKRCGHSSCLSHQASDEVSASSLSLSMPSARPHSRSAERVR